MCYYIQKMKRLYGNVMVWARQARANSMKYTTVSQEREWEKQLNASSAAWTAGRHPHHPHHHRRRHPMDGRKVSETRKSDLFLRITHQTSLSLSLSLSRSLALQLSLAHLFRIIIPCIIWSVFIAFIVIVLKKL